MRLLRQIPVFHVPPDDAATQLCVHSVDTMTGSDRIVFFFFDWNVKNSSSERSVHGSEDQNSAAKYLKNSSVERWRSVHGSETRTLHQSTTLKKELPSVAHATRVRYVGKG